MPIKPTILPSLCLFLLASCSSNQETRTIDRLDRSLVADVSVLTPDEEEAFGNWAEIIGFNGSRSKYATMPAVSVFEPIVRKDLGELDSVEQVLGRSLAKYPDVKLYGVVSPFKQAVVTHPDGRVFIALNHYLGSTHEIYEGFPKYMLKYKEINRLPVDVTEAVVAMNLSVGLPEDATVLNTLLYRGALLDETSCLLPVDTPDSTLLGMTNEELTWCRSNEAKIWQTMIEEAMLYNSDRSLVDRLFSPSPNTNVINANAPGRTALFIGLQIARSYRKHNPDVALLEDGRFLDNQSLVKSQYAPQR